MNRERRSLRMDLQHRLILACAAIVLASVCVAEALVMAVLGLDGMQHLGLVAAVSLVIAAGVGAWASGGVGRRLRRMVDTSRAWLRGNLSLRIRDAVGDDVGVLGEQLDLLAEQLEQDEEDLGVLRASSARESDQVRALAVEQERERLARELHDGVKQHLFSLAVTASAIRDRLDAAPAAREELPDGVAEMVHEVEAMAQGAQRELTRLIEGLRPASLQEQGLAGALNDYTLLFGAREHILVYLNVEGNDALLPLEAAEALYRVAQEALYNVARHARATRVDVRLRCAPERVLLTIEDNGAGFDTSQAQRGLGLASMQERMLAVSGRLRVQSEAGLGTTVSAEVALTRRVGTQPGMVKPDRELPRPEIKNWSWLGQRLVIPVGQTWPWLPADQVHLHQAFVEPEQGPLSARQVTRWLGLRKEVIVQWGQVRASSLRLRHDRSGYKWRAQSARWKLRYVRGLSGRGVLMRNEQPLAAMQLQGRLLDAWTECVYDGQGYRLSSERGQPSRFTLVDQAGEHVLGAEGGAALQVVLGRALPLPLVVMVVAAIFDKVAPQATMEGGDSLPPD